MFQRPKLGETEDDLLKQQEEFLRASGKEGSIKRKVVDNEEKLPKRFEICGDIVEKNSEFFKPSFKPKLQSREGFPKLFTIDPSLSEKKKGKKSLFAMQLEKSRHQIESMEVDEPSAPVTPSNFGDFGSSLDKTVHEENLEKLSKMTEKEILEEQKKLLSTLDPNLVNFLKNRKKTAQAATPKIEEVKMVERGVDEEEIRKNLENYVDSRWMNIDFIEKEKLEWIGDIPDKKSLEPDQPYSARFDFRGELQPFTTEIDVRNSLYHHGDEPNRPGYTIQELYQLSRSQVLQQRILALNTLANIIRKTKLGYYDRCFDGQLLNKLVESDLFFLIRFSIDDNALIAASINCLHKLLCNESDEYCLDKMLGVTYVDEQPLLYNKIDASKDEEKELKDHVVIGCDMIKGVLRTDLLVRLSYVLRNFSPNRETVIRAICCLIRITRHSLDAVRKVFDTSSLLEFVYNCIKTDTPVYEGVKLFRLLVTTSKEMAVAVTQNFDLKFLVNFIEAEENLNISKKEFYLLKLETIYFWRSLLRHDLFTSEFVMYSPCLVRLLLFYTQKVNASTENDFDFEMFSALSSLIIVCNKKKTTLDPNILIMMKICLEKWLTQLTQVGSYNFAVSKAIGCGFRYFTSYFKAFGVTGDDVEFIEKINSILVALFQSKVFDRMSSALKEYSHILNFTEVLRDPDNLPSLCSVYDGGEEFLRSVQNSSSLPFFMSVVKYLKSAHRICHSTITTIQSFCKCAKIQKYVKKVCRCRLKTHNWFMKFETSLISSFIDLLVLLQDKDALDFSFRLLYLLRIDDKNSNKILKIIFNKNNWNDSCVEHLDTLYSEMLITKREQTEVLNYKNDLIPEEWMYKALTLLRGKEAVPAVTNILKFLCKTLKQSPEYIINVPYTHRYYHLCSVFLTDSNVFDSEIQNSLEEVFDDVVANRKKVDLGIKLDKKISFYDLYTELVTQYAGVSYGLPIFAQFVLFPLQNCFSVSFRKLLWSEYLHVLRVISLPYPFPRFVSLEHFVKPCETDESLLVTYINSVANNVITKKRNPFVYYIVIGNVKLFLESKNQDEKLLTFMRKKVDEIRNEELKTDINNFCVSNNV